MGTHDNGIYRFLRAASMPTDSVDFDAHIPASRHHRTRADAQPTGRFLRPQVNRESVIGLNELKHPIRNHCGGSFPDFFRWLKKQVVTPSQILLHFRNKFRDGQTNRDMPIVSARVHCSLGHRGKFKPCLFLNCQRVHVETQQKTWSGMLHCQSGNKSGFPDSSPHVKP